MTHNDSKNEISKKFWTSSLCDEHQAILLVGVKHSSRFQNILLGNLKESFLRLLCSIYSLNFIFAISRNLACIQSD